MMRHILAYGWAIALVPVGIAHAQEHQPPAQTPVRGPELTADWKTQILAPRPTTRVKPGFTFATAGDLIYSLPMLPRKDPGVEAIADVLRGADAALTNQEGSIIDLERFAGYPEAGNGGGYPVGKPALAADIAGLGFDFASKANNHAVDFGVAGLLESKLHLEEAGVLAPGAGRSRALARAATILDTPKGRVAVIAAASTFPEAARAGQGEGISWNRPGISVVRTRRIVLVPPSEMAGIRAVARHFDPRVRTDAGEVMIGRQTFRLADGPGVHYEINDLDRFEILRAVRGAKNVADAAIFTIHAHENAGMGDDRVPADFQQALYRDVIDAGGDIVFVHGPHVTRGIEIYKGRPIFYGLGHFAFQMLGMAPRMREDFEEEEQDPRYVGTGDSDLPAINAAEYDGAVAVTEFGSGGTISMIRLYPIDMRWNDPMSSRGIPRLATGSRATEILRRIQQDSVAYGTKIFIENGVGVIRP